MNSFLIFFSLLFTLLVIFGHYLGIISFSLPSSSSRVLHHTHLINHLLFNFSSGLFLQSSPVSFVHLICLLVTTFHLLILVFVFSTSLFPSFEFPIDSSFASASITLFFNSVIVCAKEVTPC